MYQLDNPLRPYKWGSTTAIAELLGSTPSGGPEAELWIGAHPDSPSTVLGHGDTGTALDALITSDPDRALGAPTREAFGDRLPFLMKVLAAAAPLSLQVHPSPEQARAGFARENAASVPQDAPHRNYRDAFSKPELIFALTEFDALCGFRAPGEAAQIFGALVELVEKQKGWSPAVLQKVVADLGIPDETTALREAFTRLLTGGAETRAAVEGVAEVLESAGPSDPLLSSAGATVLQLNEHHPGDPGVLVALLLNRVALKPGQALYLPAGNVHAYLEGLAIEVMASSDNVLRGGLTPKFVDVPELLKTVAFESVGVPMLRAEVSELGQELYRPPFREFQLQRIELLPDGSPVPLAQSGTAVIIVTAGSVYLDSPKGDLLLTQGRSAFLPAADAPVNVHPISGAADTAVAFAVTTSIKA